MRSNSAAVGSDVDGLELPRRVLVLLILAQRVYRQRKDSRISHLEIQIAKLQNVIDGMSNSLSNFNDAAVGYGIAELAPVLAKKLRNTTEEFLTLAETANQAMWEGKENSEEL
ncbi:hypothetical protein F5884DRAFT_855953 [Xylogone sp. PMI_703]|nr:hypothetical protein F5884DRAFT_855953 [Xylogone sp. PMI_703]